MRRHVKVQEALNQMVISTQWSIWKAVNSERAKKVKALVLDDNWWACVQFVLDFTEPIMTMLRFANTNKPCFGDVYDGIDTMEKKVKIAIQQHKNDPIECETLCNKLETIIHNRWENMTTPLHLLVYALSPRYYSMEVLGIPDRVAPYAEEEVANGCKKAFKRLLQDEEAHKKVRTEFGLFASGRDFTPTTILDQYDMEAITWWYLYGQPFKHLQPLAIKVASSYAVERNWSKYSFIHSVKCNQLGSKKVENLVYIHTNLRLLSRKEEHYKDGAAKLWDVAPKSANFDATIEDLTKLNKNYDDDDDNITTHGTSSTSETALDSNDLKLAAIGDDKDFFGNPYDSN